LTITKGSALKYFFIVILSFTFISSVSAHFYVSYQIQTLEKAYPALKETYAKLDSEIKSNNEKISFYSKVLDIKNLLSELKINIKNYSRTDLAYTIVKESAKHNIDPYLVIALIRTESSFRSHIVSYKGAVGLMQLLPNTAYYISQKVNELDYAKRKELFDPIKNIKYGINYFAYLKNKFNGNEQYAIMAYNLGPTNLNRYLNRDYVPKFYYNRVMANYKRILEINGQI
jgi:soluble lytic murein transglycosylase